MSWLILSGDIFLRGFVVMKTDFPVEAWRKSQWLTRNGLRILPELATGIIVTGD